MLKYSKPAVALFALVASGCDAVIVQDLTGPRFNYFDGDFEYATHKVARPSRISMAATR